MATAPPERSCGETPRGAHPSHRFMVGGFVLQCPGGDVRASEPLTACTVLHRDRNGNEVPCPGYPTPDEHPCYTHGLGSPHDAHERSDGQGSCPGYGESQEGNPEPSPVNADAEKVRDLEHIIQRMREVLATDAPVGAAESALARVRALHRREYNECDWCSTNDRHVAWPCPTARALDGEA